jgi:hypothetical protein
MNPPPRSWFSYCRTSIMLASLLTFAGCAGPDLVIQDPAGTPIEGAKILGASMSVGGQTTFSDRKGHAPIPSAIQPTRWISVSKPGFHEVGNIDVDKPKPIVITLEKE